MDAYFSGSLVTFINIGSRMCRSFCCVSQKWRAQRLWEAPCEALIYFAVVSDMFEQ